MWIHYSANKTTILGFCLAPFHFPKVQKILYKGLSLYYMTCNYLGFRQKRSFDFVTSICELMSE